MGALSFSVGQGANVLKKIASVRVFNQGHDSQSVVSYPLRGRVSFLISHYFCIDW